uniref:Uncharacterized protein n=1 Tax=Rhizophora mucronata TaxID=61149 RepID=A0A2P2Q1F8_RHIMU
MAFMLKSYMFSILFNVILSSNIVILANSFHINQ